MQQLKNISMIIFSTMVWWVGSYLYHPVMNHYLTVSDFARFESLASMFIILGTITSGFSLYLTRWFSAQSEDNWLYRGAQRFFALLWIGIYLCYLPFVWWIDSILSIGSPLMVAMIGGIIPISFISLTQGSWLQWKSKFVFLWFYSMFVPFGKLFFGWLFVIIWFGLFGAIGWFLVSSLCATVLLYIRIQRLIQSDRKYSLSEVFRYFWVWKIKLFHFFLLAFLLSLLQNLDLVLVNRFFSWEIAGKYALVSIMMKFVIFIALSVETVYYPRLAHAGYRLWDLLSALLLLSIGSIVGYILLQFFGMPILQMINPVFIEYSSLVPYFYIFCILFVWVSFTMKIAIAHRLYLVNIWVLWLIILLFAYLHYQSNITPIRYIESYIFTLIFALFPSILYTLYRLIFPSYRTDKNKTLLNDN